MVNEEMVLDKIAEKLGESCKMIEVYGNEDNVAYACGFLDKTLIELLSYVEDLATATKLTRENKYNKDVSGIINWLTDRMENYMNDIADCCGDVCLHEAYEKLIEEDKAILDMLVGGIENGQ